MVKIYCDGGSRGNPGPAAAAFVVLEEGAEVGRGSKYLGVTTNNAAEYEAVIAALGWLLTNEKRGATFFLDSELVVRQLTGVYKIKNKNILEKVQQVKLLEKEFPGGINYQHVLREKNKMADSLVNKTLDGHLKTNLFS